MQWNKAEERLKNGSPGHNFNNTLKKCCYLSHEEHNGSAHAMKIGNNFFFGLPDLLLYFLCFFLIFYCHAHFLNFLLHFFLIYVLSKQVLTC